MPPCPHLWGPVLLACMTLWPPSPWRFSLIMQVPSDKKYVVGDITIVGKGNIRYGSMLADYVKIKLTGLACNKDMTNVKPVSILSSA